MVVGGGGAEVDDEGVFPGGGGAGAQKSFEYLTRRVEGELRNKIRSGTVKYIGFKPDMSWKAEVIEPFNLYRSGSMLRDRT